jgi:ribosomal protein L37AE/L43A
MGIPPDFVLGFCRRGSDKNKCGRVPTDATTRAHPVGTGWPRDARGRLPMPSGPRTSCPPYRRQRARSLAVSRDARVSRGCSSCSKRDRGRGRARAWTCGCAARSFAPHPGTSTASAFQSVARRSSRAAPGTDWRTRGCNGRETCVAVPVAATEWLFAPSRRAAPHAPRKVRSPYQQSH